MVRSVMLGLALAALSVAAHAADAPGDAAPGDATPGDAAKGEKAFVVCRACHQVGPSAHNAVGPVLNGIVGRPAGSYAGYNYSAANKGSGIIWTVSELQQYLANPQGVVKGTKMIFAGYPHDPQKVNDIIAYLNTYGPDGQKKP